MRPDEGGCADLRRNLTARTKLVRSPAYDRACRRCPRPGAGVIRRCARGVSAALPPEGAASVSARDDRDVTRRVLATRHRPVLGGQTPRSQRARPAWPRGVGPAISRTLARTGTSGGSPWRGACQRMPSRWRDVTSPHCREVNSSRPHRQPTNRPPRPLDERSSAELPGIRGGARAHVTGAEETRTGATLG
jgi:hypothetical protein